MAPLQGRRVVLGVSGSIGAVQAPALAARLRGMGGEVQVVLSPAALQLVGLAALRDASGSEPVTALTGKGEHVRELLSDGADLLLLAPCTANTLGKVALGLDDTPVTTFASVLLGRVPVLVAPAMHDTMWANPAVRANVARLRDLGCVVLAPRSEEDAAKLASLEEVVAWAARLVGPRALEGRRVLVVAGPTAEPVAPGHWLSNRSSAATGLALAEEAFRCGADVEVWLGWGPAQAPWGCASRRFGTVEELLALAPETARFDAVLVPAAIGDYAAAGAMERGRVPLRPTPKFLDAARQHFPGPLVAFKAESGLDDKALLARARELQERVHASLVVANRLEAVGPEATEALLVGPEGVVPFRGSKQALAEEVVRRVAARLGPGGAGGTADPGKL